MTDISVEKLIEVFNNTIAYFSHSATPPKPIEVLTEVVTRLRSLQEPEHSFSAPGIIVHGDQGYVNRAADIFNAEPPQEAAQRVSVWLWFLKGYEAGRRDPELPRVHEDVFNERQRQKRIGWTADHDDARGFEHLLTLATERILDGEGNIAEAIDRKLLVEAAALIIAAVELGDRQEQALSRPFVGGFHGFDYARPETISPRDVGMSGL